MENTNLTQEELDGVKAIQFLQHMAGIDEPFERALANWRSFVDWEKESTMNWYAILSGTRSPEDDGTHE